MSNLANDPVTSVCCVSRIGGGRTAHTIWLDPSLMEASPSVESECSTVDNIFAARILYIPRNTFEDNPAFGAQKVIEPKDDQYRTLRDYVDT